MDHFALQQAAQKRTALLVALVALAVAATAAVAGCVFTAAAYGLWLAFGDTDFLMHSREYGISAFMDRFPAVPVACFSAASIIILARWLARFLSLSSGEALMKEIGAKRIVRSKLAEDDDACASRLRLFNVCEEMSIASGLDMPSVWLLEDERGVNALAAGTDPSAAAVCVTEGTLRNLTRDELQGVIAHEFSHILNGDMRLNMRITALIAGITSISRIGAGMLSVFGGESRPRYRWYKSSSRSGKNGGGGSLAIVVVYVLTACALWLVGSIGAFFARLVQCAVSRQREFLADAAAAQFTRNPRALATALKIASADSALRGCAIDFEAWKSDVSHMLFTAGFEHVFATHPPIAERIARLCPEGLAKDGFLDARLRAMADMKKARARETRAKFQKSIARANGLKAAAASFAEAPVQSAVFASIRNPSKAGEILVGLLRGKAPEGWQGPLSAAEKRTLALRCVTTLRDGASASQRLFWAEEAKRAIQEDGECDSFEMMVMASVRRRLQSDGRFLKPVPARELLPVAARVISTVAAFGGDPAAGYKAAEKKLSLFGERLPPMPEPCRDAAEMLDELDKLVRLGPLAKKELLTGLAETVAQDGKVTDEESDYLAAVADAIGAYGWAQNMRR